MNRGFFGMARLEMAKPLWGRQLIVVLKGRRNFISICNCNKVEISSLFSSKLMEGWV